MHLTPILLALLFFLLTLGFGWLLAKAWILNRNNQNELHPDVYVGFAVLGAFLSGFNHFFYKSLQGVPDPYNWLVRILVVIMLAVSATLIYQNARKQVNHEPVP